MSLAKTEYHCPRCGKLKLKRDGSPHKCVPPAQSVRFENNKGEGIKFDPRITIRELTELGYSIQMVPKETPLPDGVFRSLHNATSEPRR